MLNKKNIMYVNVTLEEVEIAARDACKNHMHKAAVISFCKDWEDNIVLLHRCILDGTYVEHLSYVQLEKVNKNGKHRKIDSPTLITRIFQYVFINKVRPIYDRLDNLTALNCKDGCGLNASDKRKSVRHRVKSLFYDRRDVHYLAIVDQRKCYEHVKTLVFRRMMKTIVSDKWLIDFGCAVTMVDGKLPIGTPVSPLAHHIIMLAFDLEMARSYPFYVRYADNILIGCNSKADATDALWRVRMRWWYEMGIRANRKESKVLAVDGTWIDFCGTVYHRCKDKSFFDHGKGYAIVRKSTAESARKSTPMNWGCYYGQLVGADTYNLMKSIERKNMKLSELTSKIRIDRSMDAPQVQPKDISGITLDVIDYQIRQNSKGQDNWVKLLLCFDEVDADGVVTGKKVLREMHGDYQGIIQFLRAAENALGGRGQVIPIEDARIVNSCGYIFEGSTNQMRYFEDFANNREAMKNFMS